MKNKLLFYICLVFIFLASIGFSFAYFGTQVDGIDTAKTISTTSTLLKLTFSDSSSDISLSNFEPGQYMEKTITVSNVGNKIGSYSLKWLELVNEFLANEIRIEGTCTSLKNGVEDGTCEGFNKAVGPNTIFNVDSIDAGYVHQYDIKVVFVEKNKPQNYNQRKTFRGRLGIEELIRPKGTPVYANGVKPVNNCTFDGEMVQGAEYVNGQYTYKYKWGLDWEDESKNDIIWKAIDEDGWSVILTEPESTTPVTTELCTSINNKPIVSMNFMFMESQASSIDLSSFDTSNVKKMSGMFQYSEATELDVSGFDTSNVTAMDFMFWYSKSSELDVSSFDTSNVTEMTYMFASSKATELDLRNFDTSNVTHMQSMFRWCKATSIDISSFDTSNVIDMIGIFSGVSLSTIDISHFDTSNVMYMGNMFEESDITSIDLSSFDTSNVTDMSFMFSDSEATSIDLSSFDTSNVTDMRRMFSGCEATSLDLSNFDTSNVTDMSSMFYYNKATTLDLSSFDTSNVTTMSGMFYSSEATTLDLSSFDTSNVTDMNEMFYYSQATALDLSSFDTSNVTDMSDMFYSSEATIGYARTQDDADKLNATSNKPSGLTFVVK